MAYIIVHHQPADGKSLLVDILPRMTKMPVVLVADRKSVKPTTSTWFRPECS
jgi:uncharacterized protein (DUF1015 family)